MHRIIIVVSGGCLQAVYANENIDVELLDVDNGKVDDETFEQNQQLSKKIINMKKVW